MHSDSIVVYKVTNTSTQLLGTSVYFMSYITHKNTTRATYNQSTLFRRIKMVYRRTQRARKYGLNRWFQTLAASSSWNQLRPENPLDGMTLYRHALKKLVLPSQMTQTKYGRTIMLVSHC
jgi:hypothetical protein